MPVTTPAMGAAAVGEQHQWYRLVRRLATRPGSEISLVYVPDGTHDRLAVLKRLPPALATDAAAVEKFRIEARIAATLEHPSIVRVFEIAETPTDDFYTMEYVRGADMRQLMDALVQQRRTLPLDCVLLIAIELCNALDYAHGMTDASGLPAPIIHRELSPSKVLLGLDGTIKLTGFGAPPLSQTRLRRSRTESVGYTSPERFVGETMDSRSDVFALGVLIYELSSGERMFADAKTEHEVMQKILRGDMPRPSEVRRGYPRELETILMRTLARDRKERYQSASELQLDLETFLWSRWPTASTSALAKLVGTAFPSDEATDVAAGTRELERIDPFNENASPPGTEPVLWLGPVPLAKPYARVGELTMPRTDTKEFRRLAPGRFPDSSGLQFPLGSPGSKPQAGVFRGATEDRAPTADELAIPVEEDPPSGPVTRVEEMTGAIQTLVRKTGVLLGTPGAKPTPLGTQPPPIAPGSPAPRGQYQRPAAIDEHWPENPDDIIIEKLRTKKRSSESGTRTPGVSRAKPVLEDEDGVTVARTRSEAELARGEVVPVDVPAAPEPAADASVELDIDKPTKVSWTLISAPPAPTPLEVARQRLPSPPPAAIANTRKWPLGTIAAIVGVVIVGVMASAWAIRRTGHAPSDLPAVITAHPSPPTDVVLKTTQTQKATVPAPAAVVDVKKPRPRAKKEPAVAVTIPPPVKSIPPLFPPPDKLPIAPGPGSLDGLPAIKQIELGGTIGLVAVRKSFEQALSPLRGCYRAAARAKQLTPRVELTIGFEVDERRVPTKVRAFGGGVLDSLATCAAKVTSELRDLPAPKGTARVSVSLEFRPNP